MKSPINTPTPRRFRESLALPTPTDRYALGSTPLRVSPFCLGRVADPAAVLAAYDAGINFFFLTADMHWPRYDGLRRGLEQLFARGRSVRDNVVVGVVSYVTQPEFTFRPFIEVLEAVRGLDRIDMTIIGGAYAGEILVRLQEYRANQGLIPGAVALGCSFHDRRVAATAGTHGLVDVGYVRYNSNHRAAESEVFPAFRLQPRTLLYNFKSTIGYHTDQELTALGLSSNDWRPHITDYYRFVLRHQEIDGILCSLDDAAQVTALVQAIQRGPLEDEEVAYITDVADLAAGRARLRSPAQ